MSKSDNTMPWRLIDDEMETIYGARRWFVILNISKSKSKKRRKHRECRRWWHSERRRVKNDLSCGREPLSTRHRHGVLWDLL